MGSLPRCQSVNPYQSVELLSTLRAHFEMARGEGQLRWPFPPVLEALEEGSHALQESVAVQLLGLGLQHEPEQADELLACRCHRTSRSRAPITG